MTGGTPISGNLYLEFNDWLNDFSWWLNTSRILKEPLAARWHMLAWLDWPTPICFPPESHVDHCRPAIQFHSRFQILFARHPTFWRLHRAKHAHAEHRINHDQSDPIACGPEHPDQPWFFTHDAMEFFLGSWDNYDNSHPHAPSSWECRAFNCWIQNMKLSAKWHKVVEHL